MRVCLVYDCLFPYTVGGAERWYRNLAERLAIEGHEVTYLTLRQWPRRARGDVPGVEVIAVGPRAPLYTKSGRRRIGPPFVFGLGVLWHLARHGGRYDVVHTDAFPYFSVLAAAAVRPLRRYNLVVDWFELWTLDYWKEYLGPVGGRLGAWVQRACVRVRQRPLCFSRLHAARLREEGVRIAPTELAGLYAGPPLPEGPGPAEQVVVFAGRHIQEKRVPTIVPALERAREAMPGLRAEIFGDGPDRPEVLRLIEAHGLGDAVDAPGFVDGDRVQEAIGRALCLVLPSRREGYGLVVVEAAARGTPSVVVLGPDNAAAELVEDGENGFVAASASPSDLADAIARVHERGPALRHATAAWFAANARRLSLDESLRRVLDVYAAGGSPPTARS